MDTVSSNPFAVAQPMPASCFCGREEETRKIVNTLLDHHHVVIDGPHRMGKASLIAHVMATKDIASHFYGVTVDATFSATLSEFTFWLFQATTRQLASQPALSKTFRSKVRSVHHADVTSPSGLSSRQALNPGGILFPKTTLTEIFSFLNGLSRPVLLAITGSEQLKAMKDRSEQVFLSKLFASHKNVVLFFSGLQIVDTSGKGGFFPNAMHMSIGPIGRDTYVAFAVDRFRERGRLLSVEMASTIYDRFEGHTGFIQRTLHALYFCSSGSAITPDMLSLALDAIIAKQDVTYRQFFHSLKIRDRWLLMAIVREGYVDEIFSAAFINRAQLVSASSVQLAKKSLEEMGVIIKSPRGYRLSDFFFSLWLAKQL